MQDFVATYATRRQSEFHSDGSDAGRRPGSMIPAARTTPVATDPRRYPG